jgi:O-antigen polysaccharide polymerase Wzy
MNGAYNGNPGARSILALLVHIVVVLVLAAVTIGADARGLANPVSIDLVSALLLALSVWLLVSWWLAEGSLLNPYGLFLMASMPFHVGYAFLRVLDQESLVWMQGAVTEVQILETLAYVIACYAALHLGALIVAAAAQREPSPIGMVFDGTRVYQVGWLLLAISLIPLLLKIRANVGVVMSGGYSSLFEGGTSDPSSGSEGITALIASFYLPGVMFVLAGSRHRRWGQIGSFLALMLYTGSYLFMGFRAFSLIPVAVYIWLWHRCVRRLPVFPVAVTGVGAFLLIAPLVRQIRDMSGTDRLSLDVLWQAYTSTDNPVLTLVAELAGSVLTIPWTAELVPNVRPFEMGYGYLRALANAVPMWHLPDLYGYAGSWLAWYVTPHLAVGGFGLGFSFMAESYLNFGWIGGVVTLLVIGLAVSAVHKWADIGGDPARLAFLASFLPILIFFTRGESLSITRPILWYGLIPYLLVLGLRRMDRRLISQPRQKAPPRGPSGAPHRPPMPHATALDPHTRSPGPPHV